MKLKTKLASLIIGFVMVASMLFFGVWAASSANVTLGGTISFSSTNVYAEVSGTISGNANTIDPLETLTFDNDANYASDVWTRNLQFDEEGSEITMTITIKNLASDRNLYVSVIDQVGTVGNVTKSMTTSDFELTPASDSTTTDEATVTIKMKVTNPDLAVADATYGYLVDLKDGSAVKSVSEWATDGLSLSVTDGKASVTSYTGSATTLNIPAYVKDANGIYPVTNTGESSFHSCTTLNIVTLPSTIITIGSGTFAECSNLAYVNIPEGVTILENAVFMSCSITNIVIPSSVTEIGETTFSNCKLTSITIPSSVLEIKQSAFIHCLNLKTVYIANSVTSIGEFAFNLCESLTDIYFEGTEAEWIAAVGSNDIGVDTTKTTVHYGE